MTKQSGHWPGLSINPDKDGYFVCRAYAIVIGAIAFTNLSSGILFIVVGSVKFINNMHLLLLCISFGCIFMLLFSYYPVIEFWRRARPIKIDHIGLTAYIFGLKLRFLSWDRIGLIVKTQYVHPLGYSGEIIWFRGLEARNTGDHLDAARLESDASPWRSQLALFPNEELWLTSNVGTVKFEKACDMISNYARLYMIPMELRDIRPASLRLLKETASPETFFRARRYGIVRTVDHL